ncbi:glycosyltransferase family 2 protein [Candidatus Woesebacteria bacterium]|nr:glycosyltransferase family 2 protein [Candidatus Woesebacteria bacterium]
MKNLTIITLNSHGITDFAEARNKELEKAKTPWVLFVDTDEIITKELEAEIEGAVRADQYNAYYIKRRDVFLGRELKHGETGKAHFIRLARKGYGKWVRPVHEEWVGQGRVGTLSHPLIHHSHPSISSFLDKINLYSTLDAEYRYKSGVKSSLWKIAVYPIAKFKLNYLLRLGFMDGVPGLIIAMMMSFHSYLTWTKLYLLWHKK